MAIPRFYLPARLADHSRVDLNDTVARHAQGALRLREGDALILFDGEGRECTGFLQRDGKQLYAALTECRESSRESPLDITLVQGISSGERMDYTLQKAVELGVSHIIPVFMQRSVVRLDNDRLPRRHAHWRGVVAAACEQCGRNHLPEVANPMAFADWIKNRPSVPTLLLDPEAKHTLSQLQNSGSTWTLLAGPEGGFDPRERDTALNAGCIGVRMGPRILRTETAAVAALAAMQTLWGDF
jgi:16S rRNA (uracil1498-N3)-methyltransferase